MEFWPWNKVKITGGFWQERQKINRKITIEAVWNRFVETGRVDAFLCTWHEGMDGRVHHFWDSDVAKWMEAAAYLIAEEDDPSLRARIEEMVDRIEANQTEEGYFNSYYLSTGEERFSSRYMHELYCAGHLIEAAVAYHEATGDTRFLSLMERYAQYIRRVFVTEKSAKFATPGHEEIELALYRLYRTTGNKEYLELARYFLNARGNNSIDTFPNTSMLPCYEQAHRPVREQTEALGHAVRALYLYSAMADVAKEDDDEGLKNACEALFTDVTERKMYITGALGSTCHGEAFTLPYDLPDATAYAETCASIALAFFGNRMTALNGKSAGADVAERALYNGILSGLSLSGDRFFYENPLEICLSDRARHTSTTYKEHWALSERVAVFDCSCCPPNLNRLLASLGGMLYASDGDTLYVQQFAESEGALGDLWVKQKTNYPEDGVLHFATNAKTLCVRIPSWCRDFRADVPYVKKDGYAVFHAPSVTVTMDTSPQWIEAHPAVRHHAGRAALCSGPIVYCVEGTDNGDVHTLYVDPMEAAKVRFSSDFNANILETYGVRKLPPAHLYAILEDRFERVPIRFIPYFGFANRGASDMLVWLPLRPSSAKKS